MFKHIKTKLSVLIIAIVIFGVIFSTLASTLFFSVSYKNSMFNSAYVTSKQSVAQADETVSNYIFSIKSKLDNLCVETDKCTDAASLQKVISTASRLEDDIYCVSVYDMQGNVLSNGNDTDENIKDGLTDLSFDKSVYSNLKDGYSISQPHVNTLYQNKYPWVVTIVKKEYSNLFSQQVFVAIDFKFSSIAKYIDKVSIGQRGYCYIVNSKGQIIYHPQQQMLFSGLKEENTFEISELSDGIHRKKDNIYNISSLDSCNWKIVGVSFNDEITQAVKSQVVVGLIFALLFSAFMSAVIYFLLSRTVTRPVRRLVASMQKFEKQAETFEYKADMSNVAEFQTLSTSFEHMVLMIQSLVEKVHNEEIVLC